MYDQAVMRSLVGMIMVLAFIASGRALGSDVIDDFGDAGAWSLIRADGVDAEIVEVDGAVRLDYDFSAGAGYCVVRREVDMELDPNYRFGLRYRGRGLPNTLEFKLIDESGENVWWSVERDFVFPDDWSERSMRRRHFSFAWGPSGGEPLRRVGAIEIAVTATGGGKGSLWLDELIYERLPDIEPQPIAPRVFDGRGDAIGRVGPDGSFAWDAGSGSEVVFRFDSPVEFSGVELEWGEVSDFISYRLDMSRDGEEYRSIEDVVGSDGSVDSIFAPESEAREIRLRITDGGANLVRVRFVPVERWVDANAYFADMATAEVRLGAYPKYFGALSAWTVLGLPGSDDESLMSATGAIEPRKRGYSIEPFVMRNGVVESWADAGLHQRLDSGSLPIPSVRWELEDATLEITAVATEVEGRGAVLARYTLTNTADTPQEFSLVLAARPFQVLPAAQFLNTVGGAVDAGVIEVDGRSVRIDGREFARAGAAADAVLVSDRHSGALLDRCELASSWSKAPVMNRGQFPAAALRFDRTLAPGAPESIVVRLPLSAASEGEAWELDERDFEEALQGERARWLALLDRTEILVPESQARLRASMRANLGYILINADGARIQPGSRSYERSWIRDGAMTSAALIALGLRDEAKDFIEWYSAYQYDSGKVPCVVDARGPDPVDEHDAPGEFIFAIRNVALAGGVFDEDFARSMYDRVRGTVRFIESMRETRLTAAYINSADPLTRASAGLMPESISHEGYSAKPMHSYWDDFWIYRGLWDAVELAELLGERDDAERFRDLAISFGASLTASVDLATRTHGIEYVPGCVELGDFDATSTSIAYYPTGAARVLSDELLRATFERAWDATRSRMDGGDWDGMTPYEVRTVGTFVRLGWVDRAHAYLDWLLSLQDPEGWHQWGEIAYRLEEPCRFVGDMPHTWVGSGAILSILSMFAYEQDRGLVLGGGIPSDWLGESTSIGVNGLVTRFGTLSYAFEKTGDAIELQIVPGCEPIDGFSVPLGQILAALGHDQPAELEIAVDGRVVALPEGATLRLPPGTRLVVFR